jgi:hypothetical protein
MKIYINYREEVTIFEELEVREKAYDVIKKIANKFDEIKL